MNNLSVGFNYSLLRRDIQPNWLSIERRYPELKSRDPASVQRQGLFAYKNGKSRRIFDFILLGKSKTGMRDNPSLLANCCILSTSSDPSYHTQSNRDLLTNVRKTLLQSLKNQNRKSYEQKFELETKTDEGLTNKEKRKIIDIMLTEGVQIKEPCWNQFVNDMFILGASHARKKFYFYTCDGRYPRMEELWSEFENQPQTAGRELLILLFQGYEVETFESLDGRQQIALTPGSSFQPLSYPAFLDKMEHATRENVLHLFPAQLRPDRANPPASCSIPSQPRYVAKTSSLPSLLVGSPQLRLDDQLSPGSSSPMIPLSPTIGPTSQKMTEKKPSYAAVVKSRFVPRNVVSEAKKQEVALKPPEPSVIVAPTQMKVDSELAPGHEPVISSPPPAIIKPLPPQQTLPKKRSYAAVLMSGSPQSEVVSRTKRLQQQHVKPPSERGLKGVRTGPRTIRSGLRRQSLRKY